MPIIRQNPISNRSDTQKIFDKLRGKGYVMNNLIYPADLEDNSTSAHAIVFYINETQSILGDISTSWGEGAAGDIVDETNNGSVNVNENFLLQNLKDWIAKVEESGSRRNSAVINPNFDDVNPGQYVIGKVRLSDPKKRAKTAIVLGMPDNLPTASYSANYESYDNGALVQGFMAGLKETTSGGGIANMIKNAINEGTKNVPELVAALGMSTLGAIAPDKIKALQGALGAVPNPHTEFLFKATSPRTFSFEFKFRPRNPNEVSRVREIIQTFKMNMHPELSAGKHFYLVPSNFDIHYVYSNQENQWINRIGTCVLESAEVNYTPNGFSSFRPTTGVGSFGDVEGPTKIDGAPTTDINLVLGFKEISLLTKEDIEKGL